MTKIQLETDAQASARIAKRFEVLDYLTSSCITANTRCLIVSGPAGLGKSFSIEQKIAAWDKTEKNHKYVKGTVRATGLYKALYDFRKKGQILILDDADCVFKDEETLNLLKGACDTSDRRRLSWLSESNLVSEKGETVPKSFEYEGTIIFITNLDFDALIAKNGTLAPHLAAMISRAHYLSMGMKTKRDYLIRISQVIKQGLMKGLTSKEQIDVVHFLNVHSDTMRELSLRAVVKLATLRKARRAGGPWEEIAEITMCR